MPSWALRLLDLVSPMAQRAPDYADEPGRGYGRVAGVVLVALGIVLSVAADWVGQ